MRINGFGPAKVEKYGDLFLKIIRKYSKDNKHESKMEMLILEKRVKKERKAKKDPIEKPEPTEKKEKLYRDWETDRKSTRLNSSHITRSRMPASA